MKLSYEEAVLEIIQFAIEDVITTSNITDIINPDDEFLDPNETLPLRP